MEIQKKQNSERQNSERQNSDLTSEENFCNYVELHGRIESIVNISSDKDKSVYMISVVTKSGERMISPQVIYITKYTPNFRIRQRVCVTGKIGRWFVKDGMGRSVNQQCIIAGRILPDMTLAEKEFGTGVVGKFSTPPHIKINLAGRVEKVDLRNDWYHYHICVNPEADGKKKKVVKAIKRKLDRQPPVNAGDVMYATCGYSVVTKEKPGYGVLHFENVVISDFAVVDSTGIPWETQVKKKKRERELAQPVEPEVTEELMHEVEKTDDFY